MHLETDNFPGAWKRHVDIFDTVKTDENLYKVWPVCTQCNSWGLNSYYCYSTVPDFVQIQTKNGAPIDSRVNNQSRYTTDKWSCSIE